MSNILDLVTVGTGAILTVDAPPASGGGTPAPLGSIAEYDSGSAGFAYVKSGPLDTDWDQLSTSAGSGSVSSGVAGRLTLYPATGNTVDDVFVQNSQNIDLNVVAQPTRSAAIEYTVPNPGDAVTAADFVLTEGAQTINGVKTLGSNLNLGSNLITNLGTPVSGTDAANKSYVDSVAQGLDPKGSVLVASTVDLTLSGEQTIDGVLTSASRVLVKDQTLPEENGIYVSDSGAWTRALDMDSWAEVPNAFTFVEEGSTQSDTGWVCTSDAGGTLGTTAIAWVQFSGAGTYTAGNGITLSGNQFSVNLASNSGLHFSGSALETFLDGSTLSKSATGLKVATGGITNTEINASAAIDFSKMAALTASKLLESSAGGVVTVSTGTGFVKATSGTPSYQSAISLTSDVSGTLPVANGGTNSSTALNDNRIMVSSAGSIVEAAALTDGQLLIGSTGNAPVAAAIAGTTNQVVVTNGAGTITLSTPQDIHTGATPTFAGINIINSTANYLIAQSVVSTTNATLTTVSTIATTTGKTYHIKATIVGKRTGGTAGTAGDGAVYVREAKVKNIGGTLTLSNLQASYTSEDQPSFNGTISVSGTDILVRVTGASNNNLDWSCTYEVISI